MATYGEILNSLKEIIYEHQDGLTLSKIRPESSIKHDLNMDSLDIMEVLMQFEKKHNVNIYDVNAWQKLRTVKTLQDFANTLETCMKPKSEQIDTSNLTKDDVYKIIEKHLYQKYGVYFTKPTSNWYTDLGLNNFELSDFYAWAEQKFNIKMPCFWFTDINKLCDIIFITIKKQQYKAEKAKQRKHSFEKLYTDSRAVVNIIKSQRVKHK